MTGSTNVKDGAECGVDAPCASTTPASYTLVQQGPGGRGVLLPPKPHTQVVGVANPHANATCSASFQTFELFPLCLFLSRPRAALFFFLRALRAQSTREQAEGRGQHAEDKGGGLCPLI